MSNMKYSGIEWIGNIPKNWIIKKIKYLKNNEENSFLDGDWIDSQYITDDGIRYYTTGNIGDGVFKEQGSGFISEETFCKLKCKYAYPGDLIFSRLNSPYGRSCILPNYEEKCIIAVDNVILRTDEDKKYICYVTQTDGYHKSVEDYSNGATMQRISRMNLGNVYIPLPTRKEQKLIADFLDEKVNTIDSIICDLNNQIEILNKYKKQLISEIVTEGLSKKNFKNSKISFIKKIPANWEEVRTINVLKMPITDGPHETPDLYDDGIPFVSAEAVSCGSGRIDFEHIRGYISEDYYRQCCKKYVPKLNDIYMIKSGATTGKVSIVDTDIIFTIWSPLAVFRANTTKILHKFLYYALNSEYYQMQVQMNWTYGTQQNIGMRTLEKLKIALPPIDEQKEIVNYLDKKCSEIDEILNSKIKQKEQMEKYKKSVIYEYVTGKKRVEGAEELYG